MVAEGLLAGLLSNPYFSAGFGLIGVGTGVAVLRTSAKSAIIHARKQIFVSIEIPSKDKSYHWFLDWVGRKEGDKNRHVSIQTSMIQHENGDVNTRIDMVPATGSHFFSYKNKYIRMERTREKNVVDLTSGNLWETVTLSTWGQNRRIFEELLEEAKNEALKKEEGTTVIYVSAGGDWRRFGFPRKRRPLESVILDDGQAEKLLDDAKEFLNSSKWYNDNGIPYRRGYLLHGPPGTGKSSFIMALAGKLGLNICILNLHSKGISDDTLNTLLNVAPQRSIILLEDIDAALNNTSAVTFSGLLNALDGVAATEGGGRILFMTTNHYDKLQKALIRPGRIDVKECLDLATNSQLIKMFTRFYPNQDSLAIQFANKIKPKTLSMAQLQGYLMNFKNNPVSAVDNADSIDKNK